MVPKLLRLTWDGFPLHYDRRFGWGFVAPGRPDNPHAAWKGDASHSSASRAPAGAEEEEGEEDNWVEEEVEDSGVSDQSKDRAVEEYSDEEDTDVEGGAFPLSALEAVCASRSSGPSHHCTDALPIPDVKLRGASFFPLPHQDGLGNNVGNPLSKHFLAQAEAGVLRADAGAGSSAERVLRISQTISYWRNNQERISSQRALLLPREELPETVTGSSEYDGKQAYGAILPQVCVRGG